MGEWPEGYGRLVLDEVDSTNAEAFRRVGTAQGPLWILARRQAAGRGRRGRAWVMPEGNFAASLVVRLEEAPGQMALRSFVAALALFDAVEALSGTSAGLSLKWPNDVLLNGGKLSGILLESSGDVLVVGIGVNLVAAPPPEDVEAGAVRPVALLHEYGVRVEAEVFLTALAGAYAAWEARLRAEGFAPVRDAWLARAARLGEVVTARIGNRSETGVFETVDEQGSLVLKTAQGLRRMSAAELYF